jgi:hypothetical protein
MLYLSQLTRDMTWLADAVSVTHDQGYDKLTYTLCDTYEEGYDYAIR